VLRAERDENEMKNIQVVDGALNCVYDIFQASDDDFAQIFGNESDIAFGEDFQGRDDLLPVFERVWRGRVPKVQAQGTPQLQVPLVGNTNKIGRVNLD
jgi:hypothetical protein